MMKTAIPRHKIIFTALLFMGACLTEIKGQINEYSLIGHRELMGYYNPAILNSGTQASLSFFHRNQWGGIGPSNNILAFDRQFLGGKSGFSPLAWGVIVQQEEFTVYKRNALMGMYTGQLKANKYESLKFGINLGMNMTMLNTDDFDVLELSDPNVASINNQYMISSRVGISYQRKEMEMGVASGFTNLDTYTDLHAFIKRRFEFHNPNYAVIPMLVGRASEDFDVQLEGQIRLQYKQIVNVTAGYRQNFGMLFQLGFILGAGQYRGSFGYEVPNKKTKALGSTQEVLLGINWETLASKKRTKAIEIQREKDSIRFARRDSIRYARLMIAQQEKTADSLAAVLVSRNDTIEAQSDVINFEEISLLQSEVHDNTHVIMDHIQFEKGQDIISAESFEQLDQLAKYLKHHHHFKVEIQGHSDDIGTYEENIDLSERRALAVTNYVLSRGIGRDRIDLRGYGSDRPLVPNDSEENRKLNRRVEIVFHTIKSTTEE